MVACLVATTAEVEGDAGAAASSDSLFCRAIFSLSVSLPALLSDRERVGVSASNEAIVGDGGATGDAAAVDAKSASLFCRAIFSLRVSLPELFSAPFD